jgi:hypothetical protein
MTGPQTVEHFVGEDVTVTYTFTAPDNPSVTGATLTFVVARTLADAITGTNAVISATVGMGVTINSATLATADLTGGPSAGLDAGRYFHALLRTDTPDRAVACWGPWVVVGA